MDQRPTLYVHTNKQLVSSLVVTTGPRSQGVSQLVWGQMNRSGLLWVVKRCDVCDVIMKPVCGVREESGEPGGNPQCRGENLQTPRLPPSPHEPSLRLTWRTETTSRAGPAWMAMVLSAVAERGSAMFPPADGLPVSGGSSVSPAAMNKDQNPSELLSSFVSL